MPALAGIINLNDKNMNNYELEQIISIIQQYQKEW